MNGSVVPSTSELRADGQWQLDTSWEMYSSSGFVQLEAILLRASLSVLASRSVLLPQQLSSRTYPIAAYRLDLFQQLMSNG